MLLLLDNPFKFDFATIDWKVIIGALALAATIFTIVYFQWWRNRKRLSYELLSNVVLISAEKEIRDKVEIRYEGQAVQNVRLLVVKLINDGYQPIKKEDFEKSVKFIFPKARILTAEKIKFHPENITTQLNYRDDWLEVDPALFNRKDYIQFKLLLSEYTKLKIDARIVGVSAIGRVGAYRLPLTEVLFMLGFLGILSQELFFSSTDGASPWSNIPLTIVMATLILATVLSIVNKLFPRKADS